ncbi:MAG: hypothetical protein ACLRT4_07745 [Thomasclavelia sp.]
MKSYFKYFALIAILLTISCVNVSADYKGFNITAGFGWAKESTANPKRNNEYLMGIKWTSSGAGNTHKMWFRCVNNDDKDRGTILIDRPSNRVRYANTTAKNGYNYYLKARREHIINPRTQVKGTWQP